MEVESTHKIKKKVGSFHNLKRNQDKKNINFIKKDLPVISTKPRPTCLLHIHVISYVCAFNSSTQFQMHEEIFTAFIPSSLLLLWKGAHTMCLPFYTHKKRQQQQSVVEIMCVSWCYWILWWHRPQFVRISVRNEDFR